MITVMHRLKLMVNRPRKTCPLYMNNDVGNRSVFCNCKKPPKCDPKPPCDAYKPCPPRSCPKPPSKCIPDCSFNGGEKGSQNMYRNLSLFFAVPTLILTAIGVYMKIEEEDLKPRPEFVPYSYLFIRNKRFPWGDGNHSLFHNPEKNPVPPNGYETEDPNAVRKTDEEEG